MKIGVLGTRQQRLPRTAAASSCNGGGGGGDIFFSVEFDG